ncbi:substrate-binding domain-containing protein [Nocardiopsis dassonvillei]|uniref:ABC-type xylose transport system periplasmic component n=1 Tax=Nocardiopsis dassonvillei (strain ATCC 23218 / DSM 43111 / CIP 107115 / JCM 7437 / KCTC 9190 / NBRC 14626 / NCTC 10488 / NRRL B-5397 / IMRU 509) TaxID=446468 RepID=D7AZZ3_NOCDD|nr:substrate-binding domain-containing protein [Nocardiopsis dassonvillei]ADH68264.1 ABC-type xylose transport system periplasmic component [Nocardiopsis dassonvillei subsp. dassonvillei DSM 43111]NKY79923.1 substrate-binding domain-containing protein [Nocardiopsis dassonvillei]VEI88768.1 D-xylose-binding periplasmic protein precursor [Nocardiopsis dassonvillei]
MNARRFTPRHTTAGFAAAGAALALLVSGCGSLTTTGGEAEQETHTVEEGFHVGLLLPDLHTARYEAFDRPFFEEAMGELCPNCEISYANADQSVSEQQTQAQAMLTDGVDVLVLDPVDAAAAAGTVNEAKSQGVPVIAYDRLAEGGADMYVSFDNNRVGQVQAESLLEALEEEGSTGDGSIVVMHGSPTDPNAAMAVGLATGEDPELGEHTLTEVEDGGGETVPAVLLEPIAVTAENVGDTVVSDGIYSIEEICTDDYADTDFCQEAL